MTTRSVTLHIVTLAIGLSIALLVAEVVIRVAGLSAPLTYLPNPFYGWSHVPNDEYTRTTEGYSLDIGINSLGLRDFEYRYDKPPGTHRTLVLGDSFAEALQVPLGASFPKLIEMHLNNAQNDEYQIYEVLNAGTSGYGTDNELLFLRHEGYKYNPDVVLLALYIGNDIRNNWYPLENIDTGGFRKPYFTLGGESLEINAYPFAEHSSVTSRLKVFFNRNVRLYSLLRATRDRFRNRGTGKDEKGVGESIGLDSYLFQAEYSNDWNTAWQVTKRLILELRTEVEKHGAELFVAIIPTQFQVHEDYWHRLVERSPSMKTTNWDMVKPNRILSTFLNENNVGHIDLLSGFRRAATSEREYYLVADGHWNEAGHELAAELITDKLLVLMKSP